MSVVINFGCPRSGTSIMGRCLYQTVDHHVKLPETLPLHPWSSWDGLLTLAKLYHGRGLVFVRTVRHPLDVVDSFLAARLHRSNPKLRGIARTDDHTLAKYIKRESESVLTQRALLTEREVPIVEARYEEMLTDHGRRAFARVLSYKTNTNCPPDAFAAFGDRARTVRPGKLSLGILEQVATPEERDYFVNRLRDVIQREGYE